MPTYGGYYMCPEECWRWLEAYRPEAAYNRPEWSRRSAATDVEQGMRWLLAARKCTWRFNVQIVPALKPIMRDGKEDRFGLFLVRQSYYDKQYIAPITRPYNIDLKRKWQAEQYAHVKLSNWIVIWYDYTKQPEEQSVEVFPPN